MTKYHDFGAVATVANFWINSTNCSDEFHVIFKHFEKEKKMNIVEGFFTLKSYKAFKTA